MNPTVAAAWIAAGISALTLVGTLAAQYFGRRATSRDTQEALKEQSKQLDRTLAEQRTRTLNERFGAAAGQLGNDKPPEVRLAGVYAMTGLADDWGENRQTCVDVLCASLRMPYKPDPGQDADEEKRLAFQAIREVRHTVIRVIAAHLKENAAVSWQGLNFDFTGVVFDGGSFEHAQFSSGTVNFSNAVFSGGHVDFDEARFSGGTVYFDNARFSSGTVSFYGAEFSGGLVSFFHAEFSGDLVNFSEVVLSGGFVDFGHAKFSGGLVKFLDAAFSGSTVDFRKARFSGSEVNFSYVVDWSSPPAFWTEALPAGVKLPKKENRSEA